VTNDAAYLAKWHRNRYIYMTEGIVTDSFEGNSVLVSQVETSARCLYMELWQTDCDNQRGRERAAIPEPAWQTKR
jgi:hypothetical protein